MYRLSVMPVGLPPLRSRRGDVRALAKHFAREGTPPRGRVPRFTSAALAKLEQHDWPGNIRKLRNVVNRALLLRRGPQLEEADITFAESTSRRVPEDMGTPPLELPAGVTLEQMMERVERQLIENTLRRCHYHKDRAAKELGLAHSTLFKKLKQWDPDPEGD